MADTGIAIGLDIDDKSIKFVKIKQTGDDVTLLRYDIRDLLPADPAHPESKIKNVSDVIKDIFKGEKPDLPVYVCGFGTNVSLKRATIPDIPQEEIAAAIK